MQRRGTIADMHESTTIGRLWELAAVITWLIVTAFALYLAVEIGGSLAAALPLAAVFALINLGATIYAGWEGVAVRRARMAHAVQLVSALALGYVLPLSFMPIYTIIWIAMATHLYGMRVVWWFLGLVLLTWYLVMRFAWEEGDSAFISIALYGTFHLFAMLSAFNAIEAATARDRLAAVNRELVATQHLLSEAARHAERTRIARDLHDLLGHHLTALSIRLQTAERKTDGDAQAMVAECRAIARLLLSDVRGAVDTLRGGQGVDIQTAIQLLADGAPGLNVHVQIDEALRVDDVDVAESIVRCIQEALTNTLRHAGAKQCWIRLSQADNRVCLDVHDDGRLSTEIREGNGLRGMRERLSAVNGVLEAHRVNGSLLLQVEIPLQAA